MENFLYFIAEEDRRQQMQNVRIIHRTLRDESNPFHLPDRNFVKLFRLSKNGAEFVINLIQPFLQESERVTFIPKHLKILVALSFFGKCSYQLDVGQHYMVGLSQPSVSRSITEVVEAINNVQILNNWIKFPTNQQQKTIIKQGFMNKFNFPNVVGTIDCTHISIIAASAMDPINPGRVYYNRKGYTSINTQVVCDSDLKILAINARFPGSTHDSAIWAVSNIKQHLQENYLNGDESTYLLGDSGYPLQPWILTPIINAIPDSPDAAYNRAHILTRNTIERFNGSFKSRFRSCMRHRVLNYDPQKCGKIIYACAVLHNICISLNEDNLDIEEEDNEDHNEFNPNLDVNWLNEGQRIRNLLIENHFIN